jgi:hypothetical protein
MVVRTMDDSGCIKIEVPPSIPISTIKFALIHSWLLCHLTIRSECVIASISVVARISVAPSTSPKPSTISERIPILEVIFDSIGHVSNATTKSTSIFLRSLYSTPL